MIGHIAKIYYNNERKNRKSIEKKKRRNKCRRAEVEYLNFDSSSRDDGDDGGAKQFANEEFVAVINSCSSAN